ncbi:hypothetical protein ISS37_02965 [candidate division KSB1 bacterium]|nr:hypothetical protein [candidate division KSB1 bacterium]
MVYFNSVFVVFLSWQAYPNPVQKLRDRDLALSKPLKFSVDVVLRTGYPPEYPSNWRRGRQLPCLASDSLRRKTDGEI